MRKKGAEEGAWKANEGVLGVFLLIRVHAKQITNNKPDLLKPEEFLNHFHSSL